MALTRMDNVGVVLENFAAAIDFYRELGRARTPGQVEGECAGRVTALGDQRVEIATKRRPDGHGRLEPHLKSRPSRRCKKLPPACD